MKWLALVAVVAVSAQAASNPDLERISTLARKHQYKEAISEATALLERMRREATAGSLPAARLRDLLVDATWRAGLATARTAELSEQAIAIKEKLLGPGDPAVAESYHRYGNLLRSLSRFEDSRTAYEHALAIRVQAFGEAAIEVVPTLNNLGQIEALLDDHAKAEATLRRALAIRESLLAPGDPLISNSLNTLASLFKDLGRYAEAEPLYRRALAIREAAFPPNHPKVLAALNNLGNVLLRKGDYDAAEIAYRRAIALLKSRQGPAEMVAAYEGNLSVVLEERGDYRGSMEMREQALQALESEHSTNQELLALALHNMGALLFRMGDLPAARRILKRSLSIRRRVLPRNHPDTAQTLNILGNIHYKMGETEQARETWKETLTMRIQTRGAGHWEVGETLQNLALLEKETGRIETAVELYREGLGIITKNLGAAHPAVASAAKNLAKALLAGSKQEEATAMFEEALVIQDSVFGPDHPAVGLTLTAYSQALARWGDSEKALELALRAEEIGRKHARLTLATLSERQALAFVANRPTGLPLVLALARRGLPEASLSRVWDSLIRSRTVVLDEMIRRRRALLEEPEADTAALARKLAAARSSASHLILGGPSRDAPQAYPEAVERIQEEEERLERALARRSAAFREESAEHQIGLAQVASSLPRDAALIAYIQYVDPLSGSGEDHPRHCLAFVLRAGGTTEVVDLGPATTIEKKVHDWQEEIHRPLDADGARHAELSYRRAGERLRQAVWDPIASLVADAREVFIVPDGILHVVNPATFPTGTGRYLVETGPLLHFLSSERDLVQAGRRSVSGRGLLVLAGADYGAPAGTVPAEASGFSPVTSSDHGPAGSGKGRTDWSCLQTTPPEFSPLPGSLTEADALSALWRSSTGPTGLALTLQGKAAAETAFERRAPGRRILHLATHAFFLDPACAANPFQDRARPALARWEGRVHPVGPSPTTPPAPVFPMFLAGLAMAGANHHGSPAEHPGQDDGMLTAEEIASLDLDGVEWVVLSACRTGLGVIRPGEGVLGLRRAFLDAGAHTVITSLWRINDDLTALWMENLYKARLQDNRSTSEAVRAASLAMLASLRQAGRSTHPSLWGAFVAVGDWR